MGAEWFQSFIHTICCFSTSLFQPVLFLPDFVFPSLSAEPSFHRFPVPAAAFLHLPLKSVPFAAVPVAAVFAAAADSADLC